MPWWSLIICPWSSVFNFFNHKNYFRRIWNIAFYKNVLIFWYSNNITSFKSRILIINFFTKFDICAWFYVNRFSFNFAMVCIIISTISSNLSIYTFFDIEVMYLEIIFIKVLINFSTTTDYPSLFVEYISMSLKNLLHFHLLKE